MKVTILICIVSSVIIYNGEKAFCLSEKSVSSSTETVTFDKFRKEKGIPDSVLSLVYPFLS